MVHVCVCVAYALAAAAAAFQVVPMESNTVRFTSTNLLKQTV